MAIIGSSTGFKMRVISKKIPTGTGVSEIVRSVRNIDGPFRQIYTTTLIFHTSLGSRHAVVNNEDSEF